MKQLLQRIPDDIIRENILPYTYIPQPKELCEDIRDFYVVLNELKSMYETIYKNGYENEADEWLSNDISRFMNEDHPTMLGYTQFYLQFYQRMYQLKNANVNKMISFFVNEELNELSTGIQRRLALMTPLERYRMKKFLIEIN